jgi:hypothetical protein
MNLSSLRSIAALKREFRQLDNQEHFLAEIFPGRPASMNWEAIQSIRNRKFKIAGLINEEINFNRQLDDLGNGRGRL